MIFMLPTFKPTRPQLLGLALCVCSVAPFAGTTPTPSQGSAVIVLPESQTGPYFNLTLPNTIYQGSRDTALSDLRIRNAKGELLQYAWLDGQSINAAKSAQADQENGKLISASVPVFPIRYRSASAANAASDKQDYDVISTQVEKSKDGSLRVKMHFSEKKASASSAPPIAAWLIDASRLNSPKDADQLKQLIQLRLHIPASYQGVAGFQLDASDDLQHWRTIETHGQVVQIRHQGELIEQLNVQLSSLPLPYQSSMHSKAATYLRLRWQDPANAPQLAAAYIDAQEQAPNQSSAPSQLQWHTATLPLHCDTHICEYAVPRNTPIDSLRIRLQVPNTLARVQIIGQLAPDPNPQSPQRHSRNPLYHLRHKNHPKPVAQAAEFVLAESTVYRLQKDDAELTSSDIALDGARYAKIKLRVANGIASLGGTPPKIEIANIARSLTFLARGDAPYTLSWDEQNKVGGAMNRAELMPDAQLANSDHGWANIANNIAPTIPAPPINTEKAPPEKTHKLWFWLALGAALALLAAMVVSLLRKIDQKEESE